MAVVEENRYRTHLRVEVLAGYGAVALWSFVLSCCHSSLSKHSRLHLEIFINRALGSKYLPVYAFLACISRLSRKEGRR